MERKNLWGRKILAVMLSAAVATAPIGAPVMAAEMGMTEESAAAESAVESEAGSGEVAVVIGTETEPSSEQPVVMETESSTEQSTVTEAEPPSERSTVTETELPSEQSEAEEALSTEQPTEAESEIRTGEIETAVIGTEEALEEGASILADGDIAGGQVNDVRWRIDRNGKLTVEGTGDCFTVLPIMMPGGDWPWYKYKDTIVSAEVKVTEMTDTSYMFEDCINLKEIDFSGFPTDKLERMDGMFYKCNSLKSLDLSNFNTGNITDMSYMFKGCSSLESLNLSGFQTGRVTNMSCMFQECASLERLDLSSFRTSNVTNMFHMFDGCQKLPELKVGNFNTGNVTDMNGMFAGCASLTSLDLSSFETDKVTDMKSMFGYCENLTSLDLSNFNTGKVTDMSWMFCGCSSLESLNLGSFKTDRVTDMSWMFDGCKNLTSLDLSSFETDKVADMHNMFCWCSKLTNLKLDNFNTVNAADMSYMFAFCSSLTSLDLSNFKTGKVTDMSRMFAGCSGLESLDVSRFDTAKVTNIYEMFKDCGNLRELDLSHFDLGSVSDKSTRMYIFESCDKLEKIYAPYNLKVKVPVWWKYGDTEKWNIGGMEIEELPRKLKQSVIITKGQKPVEAAGIKAIKARTVYYCGDELDIDDLEVQYYGTDGKVVYVTNYTTDKDNIDMSRPGRQDLHITYKDKGNDLTAVVGLTIRQMPDTVVASGTSKDIKWEIDRNGRLTITGSGDYDRQNGRAPWYNYRSRVETAQVTVSGMTDASGMFLNCVNMTAADISGFDTKSVEKAQEMFGGCASLLSLDMGSLDLSGIKENEPDLFRGCKRLSYLSTGIKCPLGMKLPGYENGAKWYDGSGTEYAAFPAGAENSVKLYKNGYPGDNAAKKKVYFDMRGYGIQIPYAEAGMGEKIAAPPVPTDACNIFVGWYKDESFKNVWDFDNDIVTADMVLYARWTDRQPEDKDDSPYRDAERIDLNAVHCTVSKIRDKVYDGKPYEPSVRVTITENGKNKTLTEGVDYRIIYKDNINVGPNCRLLVRGSGIYGGEVTAWYSINPKLANRLKVVAGNMAVGDTSEPPVHVYDGTKLLQNGVDYRLSYVKDIAGRERIDEIVTIIARGNYYGTLTAKVSVYAVDAANIINPGNVTLSAETVEYTGSAVTNIIPTVTVGGSTLRANRDYKVQYQNNKDAGTASVIVTGKGQYRGKVVKSFEITPAKTVALTVNPIPTKTYNGKFQKPAVTVKAGTRKLVKDRDYTVYYSDNLHAGSAASVIIKGKGNYEGAEGAATFTIARANISKASVQGTKGRLTFMYGKEKLKEGTDYAKPVYDAADMKKNKVNVTITGKGDFMGSVTKTVKVRQ